MAFKFTEIKGAEKLPPISIPEGWSEPERKKTTPRGRSASPASRKSPAKSGSESSGSLASEGGKAAFSSLLAEHPDIAVRLDKHPPLATNLSQDALDKKALAFAAEYGKKIPEGLVLKFLELLAFLLAQVLLALRGVHADVYSEYQSDPEMISDLKTLIALKFGEFLNIYVVTAFKLFVLHPIEALKKGTPVPEAPADALLGTTAAPPPAAAQTARSSCRSESTSTSASTEKPRVQFPVAAK